MSAIQVVNGVGDLDGEGLASLLQTSGVETAGLEYSLIAIMGPQSSGKSTLLNHVFGTSFREMDASSGRSQTTQGIWLAVSPKLKEDTTLVLDLEGTDGRERGEDDTNFERQSALFALAVADVLLINLWHHDVGREHGSGKPLLKTILQENLKLFDSGRRKTLVFVIRDRSSKTPLEALAKTLREDLDKVWSGLSKPETPSAGDARPWDLESRFNLIFTSLPNYEEKEEEFEAEATLLRSKFKRGSEDCYLPSDDPVPGSALALSVGNIWATIKDNKNLDLPAHRVMVATVRCDQSIADLCRDFEASAEVGALREEAAEGILDDYGERCWGLVEARLRSFDEMVEFFEPSVCQTKRQELNSRLQICMRGPPRRSSSSAARAASTSSGAAWARWGRTSSRWVAMSRSRRRWPPWTRGAPGVTAAAGTGRRPSPRGRCWTSERGWRPRCGRTGTRGSRSSGRGAWRS